jgi:hypothetical protein
MTTVPFTLQPFPAGETRPDWTVTGAIGRKAEILTIDYRISAPLSGIEIPEPDGRPERRIGLWENTCLEFFIGQPGKSRYWEFNLSPSGDWNIFRFEQYRQGLYEEPAFVDLPFQVQREASRGFHLHLAFTLEPIIPRDRQAEVAISAVIKADNGQEWLYALIHPASAADFHHRDGFILRL